MALTQECVRKLFDYDADAGRLIWKTSPRAKVRVGDEAGCVDGRYVRVQVMGRRYCAHHIAWLWMTGEWPKQQIDHKDRNSTNNAWSNLRVASPSQNAANRAVRAGNKCGLKGAYRLPNGKFSASIKKDGRSKNLGQFETAEAAHGAYCAAARRAFGEFARAV